MDGIINILKPSGMTSHDVVYKIRKKFNIQKVGHTGTLDPNVAGVLPIVIGKGTKLAQILTDKDKSYRCMMSFGKQTDTSDTYGKIISENEKKLFTYDEVRNVCDDFIGVIEQVPSMYSAIKVNGQKLYKLARKGQVIENIPSRKVNIHSLDIIEFYENAFLFDISCSKGTYVRCVVEDIAKKLGTVGYMNFLVRTSSGQFDIQDSVCIGDVEENDIIPIDEINIECVKNIILDEKQLTRYINGLLVTPEYIKKFEYSTKNIYKIYNEDRKLISIGQLVENRLKNMIMINL